MKILVACEYSGRVREAFRKLGHDAWSCDLLPSDDNSPYHIQGDVLEILGDGWGMMIAHPPCTYLSSAGNRWFNVDRYGEDAIVRRVLREEALKFVKQLYDCQIPLVAVENPIGYLNKNLRKPDQIIQPYQFGEPHVKPTCLWLKGLPPLQHTTPEATKPEPLGITIRKPSKYYKGGEIKKHYFTQLAKTRSGHERSYTFQGIADAMAAQWGVVSTIFEGKEKKRT